MTDKIKVLVVEDEAIIAENLRYSLDDLGFDVVATCYTYQEAVESIHRSAVDLLLLDINLQDSNKEHNGLALAKYARETIKKPFIFLTAYNDRQTIDDAIVLQPNGYLVKPVNSATLFATIQLALERYRTQSAMDGNAKANDAPDYFFVKVGSRTTKVLWDDVYYIEAGKNYVKLRSKSTRLDYPVRGSLSYVVEQLMPAGKRNDFIKINRSIILNRNYITGYDANYVYCHNDKFENGKTGLQQLVEQFKA
ncbi:LytR/AlgR family response regulator transcription factor [Aridibaculum aurantiacum]|uniref:LytR/AlgR family response regulator transcription factor n=1 Tax=Aridibaculum aurantiacum TaxID=2810307 RepID=UPI001A961D24|nr:response regulator [Aridibaculum aurantiacum]